MSGPSNRPRIALLASGDLFGGAERQILTLAQALRPDFDAEIFASLPGPFTAAAKNEGVQVRTDLLDRGLLGAGKRFGQILETEHFDLVHTHTDRASAITAIACGFGPRWPVLRTLHGAAEFTGLRSAATQIAAHLSETTTRAHRVLVSRELLQSRRRHRAERDHIIHNGLMPPVLTQLPPADYASDRFNLVAVGRLGPVKGFEYLIRALPLLKNVAPVLHIVGDGPDRQALEAVVAQLALTDRVLFHGFRPDVHRYIQHATALVMPSLHEGIPYVLLEALWLGTPVIASAVGGIPEVISPSLTGLLVPPGDPRALAHAIENLAADRAMAAELSAAGQHHVQSHFSATAMATRYGALYQQLLASRP